MKQSTVTDIIGISSSCTKDKEDFDCAFSYLIAAYHIYYVL